MKEENALTIVNRIPATGTKKDVLSAIRTALDEVNQTAIKSSLDKSGGLTDKQETLLQVQKLLLDALILCANQYFG